MFTKRSRFISGLSTAAAVAIFPRGVRAAEFEWKFGVDQGPDDPMVLQLTEAFAKIRDESGGQLSIKAFPSSVLGTDPGMMTQLRSGALEMFADTSTLVGDVVPTASISGLGYAFRDAANACDAFDGSLGELVRKDIASKDMFAFRRVFNPGFAELWTATKPIPSVDQMAGMKIRVAPSKMRVELIRSLGASPTPVSSSEVFTALQTHVIDGGETSVSTISSLGWAPALKFGNLTEHRWDCYWLLVNATKWASLPAKLRDIVSAHVDAAALAQRKIILAKTPSSIQELKSAGLTFVTPDKAGFKAILRTGGYYARMKAEFGDAVWAALTKYAPDLG
jgi:tripartite ATP-independent transporter DctP family solute receptor